MKKRVVPLALTAGLLVAFGAIAAACGGGGDKLTLEEYFQRLDELDDDLFQEVGALGAQFEGLTADEVREQAPKVLRQQFELGEGFRDDVAELEPPAEVEEAHAAAIEAFTALIQVEGDLVEQLESAPPADDPFLIFEESEELAAAVEAVAQSCLALEQIAADNDITLDLDCAALEAPA